MKKPVFILASPNSADGELSPMSIGRIERAVQLQQMQPDVVLLATGGFGDHFNMSNTPHRELVHQCLFIRGAAIDRATPADLLSANTVEDVWMIIAFARKRGCADYGVVTSSSHLKRCRYIFECLDPTARVDFFAADDSTNPDDAIGKHEVVAMERLVAQGGVMIGEVLHPHPDAPVRQGR
ncbi:YdcF family protein [Pseudomonas sp. MPC6]|uniref:YdcF family protein n=1 Tax=unclassified Pseudomonas TaxID=196821 RepID=UPI0011102A65|nr:YdcF family protein [Pseudomonas sp. MPC6]QCY13193.1 YdcF family protein [Pseudomonas sp. MPC6]